MGYSVKSSDSKQLLMVRDGAGCTSTIFALAGLFFFLVGLVVNYFSDSYEFPMIAIRIVVPVFGFGFMILGLRIPAMTKASRPETILFDHEQGLVTITMSVASDQKAYIAYNDLVKFDVEIEKETSSTSSSGRGSMTTTYYYYHVYMQKRDGGRWYLAVFSKGAEADKFAALLRDAVNLETEPRQNIPLVLTEKVKKEEQFDRVAISWKNEISIATFVMLMAFCAVFLTILIGFMSKEHGVGQLGGFGYVVLGFIFLVFCLVIGFIAKDWFKQATTGYSIAISKKALIYSEYEKSTERLKSETEIPLQQLYAIKFTFDPEKKFGAAGMTILSNEEHERMVHVADKPIQMLKDLVKGKDKSITLKILSLNPVEYLQLETWLEGQVRSKGNAEVL
jgi:preprotein translocase subunit SecG